MKKYIHLDPTTYYNSETYEIMVEFSYDNHFINEIITQFKYYLINSRIIACK